MNWDPSTFGNAVCRAANTSPAVWPALMALFVVTVAVAVFCALRAHQ